MPEERTAEGVRATIALQGSGRLAGVLQVLKVKLEPKSIEWEAADERTVAVRGEIHSYMYFLRSGNRKIEGEGLSIPFARRIEVPGLGTAGIEVEVEDLASEYEYDPVTTDFHHRINVVLRIRKKEREPQAADLPPSGPAAAEGAEAPGPSEGGQAVPAGEDEGGTAPDQAVAGGAARGGAPLDPGLQDEQEAAAPVPTAGEEPPGAPAPVPPPLSWRSADESRPALGEAAGETRISQVRFGHAPAPHPAETEIETEAETEIEIETETDTGIEPPRKEKEGGEKPDAREQPLVWKPFPPPINP